MTQDKEQTKVIFRKYAEGDIIALFPELAGDMDAHLTCLSYIHVGQHGSASVFTSYFTYPANESEYTPLKRELESLGYNLRICKRMNKADLMARIQQVKR